MLLFECLITFLDKFFSFLLINSLLKLACSSFREHHDTVSIAYRILFFWELVIDFLMRYSMLLGSYRRRGKNEAALIRLLRCVVFRFCVDEKSLLVLSRHKSWTINNYVYSIKIGNISFSYSSFSHSILYQKRALLAPSKIYLITIPIN